jgi:hypothetical protein
LEIRNEAELREPRIYRRSTYDTLFLHPQFRSLRFLKRVFQPYIQ